MAAPTTAARVKKTLANPEPSTHGPEPDRVGFALALPELRDCGPGLSRLDPALMTLS
jgi:hypothetical protein